MQFKNKKGFSLIELLAVVLILGVLASIAMPMFQRAVLKSRSAEVNNLLSIVRTRQAQTFAKQRKYDESFETRNLMQISKSIETNNGNRKIVNGDYELELIDEDANVNGETKHMRCVIGRYKPNGGEANFAFAISYVKSGLACSDSETGANSVDNTGYSKKICASFGDIVVGSIDDLCEVKDAEQEGLEYQPCCFPYEGWDWQTGQCKAISGVNVPQNMQLVSVAEGCLKCQYCDGEGCQEGAITPSHDGTGSPAIPNIVFKCKDSASAVDPTADSEDLYKCNSRYYKVWSNENCGWICPDVDHSDICPNGTIWKQNLCICDCPLGDQCGCDPSQQWIGVGIETPESLYDNPTIDIDMTNPNSPKCECKNKSQTHWISDHARCVCNSRPDLGEADGFRIMQEPFEDCECPSDFTPVFAGTTTLNYEINGEPQDPHHVLSIFFGTDQINYIKDQDRNKRYAACCNNTDVWANAGTIDGIEYDACCPHTNVLTLASGASESATSPVHIQFNPASRECCGENTPFFNLEAKNSANNNSVMDPHYNTKPIGDIPAEICHKCQELTQAHDDNMGCYTCPGKTFTTWNGDASRCSCPTGTTGDDTITPTSENCQCTKPHSDWVNIAYVNYPDGQGVGFVGDNVWHANNGACKCITNYTDTYFGKQMGSNNENAAVDSQNGYCCPDANAVNIYGNSATSNQKACCPAGYQYFHDTNFAGQNCGICENETDTSLDGTSDTCQPCPAGMYPQFDANKGYSLCYCPTGTEPKPGKQDGIATNENICKCKLDNATWNLPSGVSNDNFVSAMINGTTDSLSGWNSNHGYCSCNGGYGYSTQGTEADTTGYCCPTSKPNDYSQLWHQTTENPEDGFCCKSDVAFRDEAGYENCCAYPYYFSLSDLESAGLTQADRAGYDQGGNLINSVATNGGCALCEKPYLDKECNPCLPPKVPVWNNNRDAGFSTCVCPNGTREEKPSWLEYVFSWFGYEIPEQACYCDIPGTTWQEKPENGSHCVCYQGQLTTSFVDKKQACCQADEVFAAPSDHGTWEMDQHRCCKKGKNFFYNNKCQICPQDRPYYYKGKVASSISSTKIQVFQVADDGIISRLDLNLESEPEALTLEEVEKFCHACPQDKPYSYSGYCCPEVVTSTSTCVDGSGNSVGVTIPCIQNSIAAQYVWDGTAFACGCVDGSDYTEQGCLCQSICGEGTNIDSSYYNSATCACEYPRQKNNECCSNSNIDCCSCPSGYVDMQGAAKPHDKSSANCCLTNDYDSSKHTCCGQGIAYNENAGSCCTEQAPYYDSSNHKCYRCSDDQILDTNTNTCKSCPGIQEVDKDSWSANVGAYTACKCPGGSSTGNGGSALPGQQGVASDQQCKCPQGQYYLTSDYVFETTYNPNSGATCQACPDQSTLGDDSNGVTKCLCPTANPYNFQANLVNGQCVCNSNSGYHLANPTTYEPCDEYNGTNCKCVRCPGATLNNNWNWNVSNNSCIGCSANQYWDGTNCVDCISPKALSGNWNYEHGAYEECVCPPNSIDSSNMSANNGGYPVPNINGQQTECRCPLSPQDGRPQYYLTSDFTRATTYQSGASCKTCGWGETLKNVNGVDRCWCETFGYAVDQNTGACICESGKVLLDDNDHYCTLGSSTSCMCRDCPRGFTAQGGQCVCNGNKFTIQPYAGGPSNTLPTGCDYNTQNCYCISNCSDIGMVNCSGSCGCPYNVFESSVQISMNTPNSGNSGYMVNPISINIDGNTIGLAQCRYICPNDYSPSNPYAPSNTPECQEYYYCQGPQAQCSTNGKINGDGYDGGDLCGPVSCTDGISFHTQCVP